MVPITHKSRVTSTLAAALLFLYIENVSIVLLE